MTPYPPTCDADHYAPIEPGIRLIAMDMDNTLLGADKRLSPRNLAALHACEERGIMTVLASGRSFESLSRMAMEWGLHSPIISTNGARVDASPNGPTIMEDVFPRDQAERVFRILQESEIYFVCYARGTMYQNNLRFHPEETRGLNQMRIDNEMRTGSVVRVVCDEAETFAVGLSSAMKFIAFCLDEGALNALRARLARETDCEMNSSWRDNVEVMPHGAGKGRALSYLTAHCGLHQDQVMAFGDYDNDLGMLKAAGWPVAMENAVPSLKAVARIIAPHFDQSGVAAVIEARVLGRAL